MSFLTINGLTVRVFHTAGTIEDPVVVGDLFETFDGGTRDGRRALARRWSFTTPPLSPADYQVLYALLTINSPVEVTGDAVFGWPTWCRARLLPSDFVLAGGAGRPYRTLSFELRELDASAGAGQSTGGLVMWRYRPGDAGYTLTRASVAGRRRMTDGVWAEVAANVLRDDHLVWVPALPGMPYLRGTLVEGASTNIVLRSVEFDNVYWERTAAVTVTANAAVAPDAATASDRINRTAVATNEYIWSTAQSIGATADRYTGSVWVMAGTHTKLALGIWNQTTGAWLPVRGWLVDGPGTATVIGDKVEITGLSTTSHSRIAVSTNDMVPSNASIRLAFYPGGADFATAGAGNLYLWGAQLEKGPNASSFIRTTTASATRAAETFVFANPPGFFFPQACTLYVRWVRYDSHFQQQDQRVFGIRPATTANQPRINTQLRTTLATGVPRDTLGEHSSTGGTPQAGVNDTAWRSMQLMESRLVYFVDGKIRQHVTVGAGAEQSSVLSGAPSSIPSWPSVAVRFFDPQIVANSAGGIVLNAGIFVGERSLGECRALAGAANMPLPAGGLFALPAVGPPAFLAPSLEPELPPEPEPAPEPGP